MRIIYRGVDLLVLETHQYDWEPVYDDTGTDYLYTRVSILVRAMVNGQAAVVDGIGGGLAPFAGARPPGPFMSYDWDSGVTLGNGNPQFRPPSANAPVTGVPPGGGFVPPNPALTVPAGTGMSLKVPSTLRGIVRRPNAPVLTQAVVRHRLSTPRGKLYVFAGRGMESGVPGAGTSDPPVAPAVLSLESPIADFPTDCKNGPLPKLFNVSAAVGDANTLVVDWGCETFVNEAADNDVAPAGGLLSNRFSQTHLVGEDGYTTIATSGKAIFRTDVVFGTAATGFQSPDVQRAFCMLPIPLGFVRENVQVTALPDVTGIEYAFQDRQVSVNFPAGPFAKAAKISVHHRQAVSVNGGALGGVLNAYERILGLKAQKNFATERPGEGGSDVKALAKQLAKIARRPRTVRWRPPMAPPGSP